MRETQSLTKYCTVHRLSERKLQMWKFGGKESDVYCINKFDSFPSQ